MSTLSAIQKINRCLISVSDKSGIVDLAKFLESQNIEIISTGGTKKLLADNGVKVSDISSHTDFPEIMNGRLKTLHPKVHGGLLAVNDNPDHIKQAEENDISSIDLLIVNLYPFVETLAKTDNEATIIENIDIGGPAMVRSAAKNFKFKAVVTNSDQYQDLINEINKNSGTSFEFRKNLASQAFKNIADYDLAISNYFNPDQLIVSADLKQTLRYGENSHQKASLYSSNLSGIVGAEQIQGKELSYNNLNDANAAYNLILEFHKPACTIIKHANPCGTAIGENIIEAYDKALSSDPKSAFGGIVALNGKIDEQLAIQLSKMFYEVIIAPEISEEAKEILAKKKNLRVLITKLEKAQEKSIKSISGGLLVQDIDSKQITPSDLKQAGKIKISDNEIEQLIFTMSICKHVKSNAIVITQDFQSFGIGAGQMSRVDSCQIACEKASKFGEENLDKAKGGFLASDAFFPFADNIEIAAKYGIKAIIAPSGSIRDNEVIQAANQHGIALYFIETRHFSH